MTQRTVERLAKRSSDPMLVSRLMPCSQILRGLGTWGKQWRLIASSPVTASNSTAKPGLRLEGGAGRQFARDPRWHIRHLKISLLLNTSTATGKLL